MYNKLGPIFSYFNLLLMILFDGPGRKENQLVMKIPTKIQVDLSKSQKHLVWELVKIIFKLSFIIWYRAMFSSIQIRVAVFQVATK